MCCKNGQWIDNAEGQKCCNDGDVISNDGKKCTGCHNNPDNGKARNNGEGCEKNEVLVD